MRFLSGVWKHDLQPWFDDGTFGLMHRPGNGYTPSVARFWAADNGCYGRGYPGDDGYLAWLDSWRHIPRCMFATAPDVVGDAAATLERSLPLLPAIRALGYRAALVAQNHLDAEHTPWETFDVLFIGGCPECRNCRYQPPPTKGSPPRICHKCGGPVSDWKLSPEAVALTREAHTRGKGTHVGRVNFAKRIRKIRAFDAVDSIDGTRLGFGSDANLGPLLAALGDQQHQGVLI